MKIGIDARALGSNGGGDETYIRNVIRALSIVDPRGNYTIFLSPLGSAQVVPGTEYMRYVVVPPNLLQIRIPLSLPLALAAAGVDVLHAQYLAPLVSPARTIVSVHDIAYERYPEFFTPPAVMQLKAIMPLVVRQAGAVLTLSEYSKRDIVRRYKVPPERVVVTSCAADPMFRQMNDAEQLRRARARYKTGERFILCVGNLQPRKNIKTLIRAYVSLCQAGTLCHKLVLVGRKAWLHDETFAVAHASGYEEQLVFTDYVPADDLVALYNAADLFVYPSIFEGFGLPPLEAMACGTPVVTSNTSAIPEVVGNSALMVDPLDPDALARAIASVLSDSDLRSRLIAAGLERASYFTWESTAQRILNVYSQVAYETANNARRTSTQESAL